MVFSGKTNKKLGKDEFFFTLNKTNPISHKKMISKFELKFILYFSI